MGKRKFIEAHLEEPALKQRWPNYKARLHQIERMWEQRSRGGPATESAAPEPDEPEAINEAAPPTPAQVQMMAAADASTQPGDDDAKEASGEATQEAATE